jgi:hypothetical protein
MCLVGITIGGIGLVPDPNWIVFWVGVVIALAAGVVARIMSAAGMGADRAEEH